MRISLHFKIHFQEKFVCFHRKERLFQKVFTEAIHNFFKFIYTVHYIASMSINPSLPLRKLRDCFSLCVKIALMTSIPEKKAQLLPDP